MARSTREEVEERIRVAEELMVRRMRSAQVESALVQRFGMSRRQARKYMRKVRDRWAKEASTEDRTSRRVEMRQSANDLYQQAINRRVPLKDANGDPVLDSQGRPVTVPLPDLRAAARALDILSKLDGLFEQTLNIGAGEGLADLMALAFDKNN